VYVSDIRKAERDLGWVPQISMEQGLAELRKWVEQNVELFDTPRLAMPKVQAAAVPQHSQSALKEIVR
jgi:dTDP-D-glucose 4,6-dehydratase